jgi:dipeptidyl aminopeptidase/acylaminoacyl peptidase
MSGARGSWLILFSLLLGGPPASFAASGADLESGSTKGPARQEEPPALELFLAQPRVLQVALSPDGLQVAALLREEGGNRIQVLDALGGESVTPARSKLVTRIAWALDGSGLFLEAEGRLAFQPLGSETERPFFVWRLDRLREQEYEGVDPVAPHHVLVSEKDPQGLFRLLRIDPEGHSEEIYRGGSKLEDFLLLRDGRVGFVTTADGQELIIHRARDAARPELETGVSAAGEEVLRCSPLNACGLVALAEDGGHLLLLSRPESNLRKLARVDLATGGVEILHGDPQGLADLAAVHLDPLDGTPLLAVYRTDALRSYGLTAAVREHLRWLGSRLPAAELEVDPRSPGRRFWLVTHQPSTRQFRRFFVYDTEERALHPILEAERLSVPGVGEELLVEKRHLSYPAKDGRTVYGFLSVPKGADLAETPMVARIHGGPWNHVTPRFDALTQFLVSRGYIVFEPNFRASTGYGLDHLLAARGEFGAGRVHEDIVDGVRWLLSRGVGDGQRVGIVGHSFGGFSTLGAVAFSPQMFRLGIASAPAIDLLRSLEDVDREQGLPNGKDQVELLWNLVVDRKDAAAVERLQRNSPDHRLAETARPLLILAGARDEKIPLVDVQHYALALDELGKDVSLLVDEDSGHSFLKPRLRQAYLYLVERFLAYHLGGTVTSPASLELQEYLNLRLSLRGKSLQAALQASLQARGGTSALWPGVPDSLPDQLAAGSSTRNSAPPPARLVALTPPP